MKKLAFIIVIVLSLCTMVQAENTRKREMRGAWITTVWAIDWPNGSWGNVNNAERQKAEMIAILDSLQAARMNAAFLQVRGFSDAMYNSDYEPWSTYLTGTRGGVPTYDPLSYAIEEAHRRGIELHVWLNPYRYSSSQATYGALPTDYANTHPDWIIRSDAYTTILNPGLPAVRKRICEIIGDIMAKYDIDGVIMDDYFYHNVPLSEDRNLWQSTGTTMNQNDWRREQIHEMVRMVHDTIQQVKPWVTFGIGPAPQTCSTDANAAKFGVEKMRFSDWQFNSEWSEPIQWYYEGTVDYISPQIYFTIGSANDYEGFCQWWSKVSNQFGRHFYASESLSGINNFGSTEIGNQMQMDRDYDMNDAPGHIWYGFLTGMKHNGFIRHIRNNVNPYPALPPSKAWRPALSSVPVISGMARSGNRLTWVTPANNLRYAVYCVPTDSLGNPGVFASGKYLLGMAYTNSFTVPAGVQGTFAVAAVDRYGHEYTPFIMGRTGFATNTAATLVFPADQDGMLMPSYFSWTAVPGVDSYVFQLSKTADFSQVDYSYETIEPQFFSGNISWIKDNVTYYWRVVSRMPQARDAVSAVNAFHGTYFHILSPTDGSRDVSVTPTFTCDNANNASAVYTFEVATSGTFTSQTMVYTTSVNQPQVTIPAGVLSMSTNYYVRAKLLINGMTAVSSAVSFRTVAMEVPTPEIISPADGDTIYGQEVDVRWQEQPALSFRLEMSTAESFAGRLTKATTPSGTTFSYTYKNVEPGTYYLRIKAQGDEAYTDYSPVVTIQVMEPTALEDVELGEESSVKTIENGQVVIIRNGVRYNVLGQKIK